jgi:hypothetical protein
VRRGGCQRLGFVATPIAAAPSTLGFNFRLTGQDAILARRDSNLRLSNVQVKNFSTNLNFPSRVGPIVFKRGWASVDVRMAGRTFRFATTHLEPTVGFQAVATVPSTRRLRP